MPGTDQSEKPNVFLRGTAVWPTPVSADNRLVDLRGLISWRGRTASVVSGPPTPTRPPEQPLYT